MGVLQAEQHLSTLHYICMYVGLLGLNVVDYLSQIWAMLPVITLNCILAGIFWTAIQYTMCKSYLFSHICLYRALYRQLLH